jgi:phosphohistidine swiveling domain-containing protein
VREMSFAFNTKAHNLIQLKPLVTKSTILDMVVFTVKEWDDNLEYCLKCIEERFSDKLLVVRSSSTCEDTFESSLAGQFESVLNVQSNRTHITQAVQTVINSYLSYTIAISDFEVLVQPMITNVQCSGVMFTRTLETFAPYYVINYDDTTTLTDTVTSGAYANLQQVLIYKEVQHELTHWMELVRAAAELEVLCNCDYLDIEFALDHTGNVFILQVRPIVNNIIQHHEWMDKKTRQQIQNVQAFITHKMKEKHGVFGTRTIFGQMPDWNPAEIIGTRPKPLAYSLYRYLIMDSAWRKGRQMIGYQTPESYELMVQIAGSPYVDVRASFHSLLPQGLSSSLSEKLVNHYIDLLEENPHYHDKIEFNIVHSCLDFSFQNVQDGLLQYGFSYEEARELQTSLLQLTNSIINDEDGRLNELLESVEHLTQRRTPWEQNIDYPLDMLTAIDVLLKDCIVYGTIPFAAFARCAFIGTQLMRSLVDISVLEESELQQFLNSIVTVAGQYTKDINAYSREHLSLEEMCQLYGHLRPGTYDITTPRYDERPDVYLVPMAFRDNEAHKETEFTFSANQIKRIENLLKDTGFKFNVSELITFVTRSITLRERIKFEFTKNISLALKYVGQFGEYYGFTKEDIAFVSIEQILKWNQETTPETFVEQLRHWIDEQKSVYTNQKQIILKDLIVSPKDLEIVQMLQATPNFTSNRKITAETVNLQDVLLDSFDCDLEGKIICIEQADPGFDWIFSRNIGGLVTKFGGVASHMAVRCAEFGIPAAIGCGDGLYQKLLHSRFIELNCLEKRVSPCEGFL